MSDSSGPVTGESIVGARSRLAGALWMLFAASCIGVVDGMAKYLSATINGVQVTWGYCGASLICFLAVSLLRREPVASLVRTRRLALQVARAASLVFSLSSLFLGLRYLPLAVATTVAFTAPLIIAALSGPMLGERVGAARWLAVLVGMTGAMLVVRPGTAVFHWASLLPLLGAFFFAAFNIATRMLGDTDRPMTTVFYTFAVSTALVSLAVPVVWTTPSGFQWSILAASGVLGFSAHFGIARSLALTDASFVAPLQYVRLLWAIGIGVVVFGHWPDAWTLMGGGLIVASGLFVLRSSAAGQSSNQ